MPVSGHEACGCFGRMAVRLGLITPRELRLAQVQGGRLEATLVRRGHLTPALVASVREVLEAHGPCRAMRARGA